MATDLMGDYCEK